MCYLIFKTGLNQASIPSLGSREVEGEFLIFFLASIQPTVKSRKVIELEIVPIGIDTQEVPATGDPSPLPDLHIRISPSGTRVSELPPAPDLCQSFQ